MNQPEPNPAYQPPTFEWDRWENLRAGARTQ